MMKTLKDQSESLFMESLGYLKTLERSLVRKSKFSNELLYQIAAMSIEKMLVAFLASHEINATHHTPMALIYEANTVEQMPDHIVETAKLIGRFESICSVSGFGYKIPNNEELKEMILGLVVIKNYVSERINSVPVPV
jgi:hypothetical protein